jgi:predicted transcriptional regulator
VDRSIRMTRGRGELQLQLLGSLVDGPSSIAEILTAVDETPSGKRKCEIVLERLQGKGLVRRNGESQWFLTLQGRGYVEQVKKVLGGCD